MTNPVERQRAAAPRSLIALLLLCAGLNACGEDKKKVAPAPAPAPSAPAKPAVTLNSVDLHPKVQFPEDRLPDTQEALDAIVELANAIASGDAAAMQQLLSPPDQAVLKSMVEQGLWQRQADSLKVVRVCVLKQEGQGPVQVGLGLEDAGGAFLSGWEAANADGVLSFSGMAIEPEFAMAAVDLDNANLKPMALPSGLAQGEIDLRAAEPPKRVESKAPGASGGGGGSSPSPSGPIPRRRRAVPPGGDFAS